MKSSVWVQTEISECWLQTFKQFSNIRYRLDLYLKSQLNILNECYMYFSFSMRLQVIWVLKTTFNVSSLRGLLSFNTLINRVTVITHSCPEVLLVSSNRKWGRRWPQKDTRHQDVTLSYLAEVMLSDCHQRTEIEKACLWKCICVCGESEWNHTIPLSVNEFHSSPIKADMQTC